MEEVGGPGTEGLAVPGFPCGNGLELLALDIPRIASRNKGLAVPVLDDDVCTVLVLGGVDDLGPIEWTESDCGTWFSFRCGEPPAYSIEWLVISLDGFWT